MMRLGFVAFFSVVTTILISPRQSRADDIPSCLDARPISGYVHRRITISDRAAADSEPTVIKAGALTLTDFRADPPTISVQDAQGRSKDYKLTVTETVRFERQIRQQNPMAQEAAWHIEGDRKQTVSKLVPISDLVVRNGIVLLNKSGQCPLLALGSPEVGQPDGQARTVYEISSLQLDSNAKSVLIEADVVAYTIRTDGRGCGLACETGAGKGG